MRKLISFWRSCLVLTACTGLCLAQDYRARVQGNVLDQTQAAVTGAKVTLTNQNTGVELSRLTDSSGRFLFDYVAPGTYTIRMEMAGFSPFSQENITVLTRGDVTVNGTLSVGGITQTVNVSESVVALEFNTSTMSQTVTGKMLQDLPILARNPFTLVLLDPAVVNRYSTVAYRNPFYMQAANGVDVGGATGGRNDILLDGVPIGVDSRGSYSPSMDSVQEVSIQQNSVDAEFGFSAGGNMSVSMKSGTNEYHGTGYYFGRNPALNALANRYTRSENLVRQHIGGGTIGGPIFKNKLFTFFSYERWSKTEPREGTRTLPTDLERTGDFSRSLNAVGGLRTIYDPWSTQFDAATSTATRTPFPNNVIPNSRIDPSAAIVMGDLWKPNGPGDDITGTNNFKITYPWWTKYYNLSNRTDWNVNDKFRMYARYSIFRTRLDNNNYGNSPATPSDNGGLMDSLNAAADGVYTMNPSTVLNVRFGATYLEDDYDSDWAKVGEAGLQKVWPNTPWYTSYIQGVPAIYYPAISVAGKGGFGKGSTWFYRPRKYSASGTLAKDRGRHYMKFGLAYRHSYGTSVNPNLMNWIFSPNYTANTFISPNTLLSGDSWATFLLGAIDNSSNANFKTPQNIIRDQWGLFFQDDFKLNRNLTLNLGLRYEYETAPVEELDRMSRYLDLTNPIPEMQAAPPQMPGAATAIRTAAPIYNGAWVFTDENNRALYRAPKTIFLPRVGIAYRLNDKSALRIGYARYAIPMVNAIGSSWYVPVDGYNATSNPLPSVEGIPNARFSNPFPAESNPLIPSAGKSWGRYTNLGQGAVWFQQDMKAGMNDRLNVTLQRELPTGIRADITYFYAYTHHHQAPNIWGGTGTVDNTINMYDPALNYQYKGEVDRRVNNPFYGYMTPDTFPGSLRNQRTVTVRSLLSPYPQYGSLMEAFWDVYSNRYHALQLKAERSFAAGYSFMVGYNYNREATTEFFNDDDRYAQRLTWIGSNNPRHRISSAGTLEFPFGKGRRFGSNLHPVLNAIFGGWSTSHIVMWNSGPFLRWGQLNVTGDPIIDNPSPDKWFNTSAFAVATPYTPRTNPWQYPGLTGPGYWSWDGTLVKYFQLTERFRLEFRAEAYNAPNSFMLNQPNLSVTDARFGKSIGPAAGNFGREVQYTVRVHF